RLLAIAALLSFTLLPIYWIVVTSLRPDAEVLRIGASMLPQQWTLEHYRYLFTETDVGKYLTNSVVVALASTAVSVGLSL
ncbi:carbohydrate ABC transporter permease, partial [Rhizobiaceae sp. 2RAB30]